MPPSGPFPPEKLLRYPHMFPLDIAIWERFLDEKASQYQSFWYDWKVGTGTEPAEHFSDGFKKMVQDLSRYRIDVIGVFPGGVEVFEVKPNASMGAIGQVQGYVALLREEHPELGEIVPALVTDRELPDMARLTAAVGVNYYIV